MKVSVFKSFNQVIDNLELSAILEQIKDGRYKKEVIALRELLSKGLEKEYKHQKKSLLAFTPSAIFEGGRKPVFFKDYSSCIILDIDNLTDDNIESTYNLTINCTYTYACFRSPSNNGLKILVFVDTNYSVHYHAFFEVFNYYEKLLNVKLDSSGQDITRLCFYSFDENIFINPNYSIFKTNIFMLQDDIEKVVQQIESKSIDITNNYKDWLRVGFALTDGLGAGGRDYFHRVSKFYSAYDLTECDTQFDKCLKSNKSKTTIKSFFYLAKDYGIDISPVKSFNLDNNNEQTSNYKPDFKKKKKISSIDLIENYLNKHYDLRYNLITDKLEVRTINDSVFNPMTDYTENSIFRELLKSDIECNINKLRNILCSDFCKKFEPFKIYFNSLPKWDGVTDHITELAKTVNTSNDSLWYICFKKWVVAVCASLLKPEVINHTAIIFSGPQGIGKTTWLENLCPAELKQYLFSGTINPNNKDTLVHLAECMFINMDELENMSRTEIGTLKEIITKSFIRIRRAYGHNSENLVRRASFMGSVNTSQFLNDATGSRRFLCFEVSQIDYKHKIDINLVYSQAISLFHVGFKFYFDKEDINEISENNEQYQIRTSEEELLLTYFETVSKAKSELFYNASTILTKIAEKAKITVTTGAVISIGKALKKHGFEKTKKGGVYVWAVKELSYDDINNNFKNVNDFQF